MRLRLRTRCRRMVLPCLTLEVRQTEIVTLIRKGLLSPESQRDNNASRNPLYSLLDRHLGGGM